MSAPRASVADISRGDAGDVGWFPMYVFHAARRAGPSATIGIMLILGGAGLFLCHVFNLWALQMAVGVDLSAAVYHVLAGLVFWNIVCYEPFRKLVVNREMVSRAVSCGVRRAISTAGAVGTRCLYLVLGTAKTIGVSAANFFRKLGSLLSKAARLAVCSMLRAAGRVARYAADLLQALLSFVWNGATSTVHIVFGTVEAVGVIAAGCLRKLGYLLRKAARLTAYAMRRVAGRVVRGAAGFPQALLSFVRNGATGTVHIVLGTAEAVGVIAANYVRKLGSVLRNRASITAHAMRRAAGRGARYAAGFPQALKYFVWNGATSTVHIGLGTAEAVGVTAANCLRKSGSVLRNGTSLAAHAMCRAAGRVVRYAVGFPLALLSFIWNGVTSTVHTVLRTPHRLVGDVVTFMKTKIFRRWNRTRRADDREHEERRPRTIDEPRFATQTETEGADVLPPRSRYTSVVSQEVQRPSHRMALRSDGRPTHTAPPPAELHPWHQAAGGGEGIVRDRERHYRAPTRALPSTMEEMYDAPATEHVRADRPRFATETNVATSSSPPRPDVKMEPAEQTARPPQRRWFNRVQPNTEATSPRQQQASTGGGDNVVLPVAIQRETRTRERGSTPVAEPTSLSYRQPSRNGSPSPTQAPTARVKREFDFVFGGPARRVKSEHPSVDNSSSDVDFHDGLAPPRGSVTGSARIRPSLNIGGKHKRRRSAEEWEEKRARRQRIDAAKEIHCCKADPADMAEMWVFAQGFDKESGEVVPGVFHYVPVTLIRQSKHAIDGKLACYVQPGGQNMRAHWDEGSRVVWKVPAENLFHKAPAPFGLGCETCGSYQGPINWTLAAEPEPICDSCADAPRRELERNYDARDLGYKRACACRCGGW